MSFAIAVPELIVSTARGMAGMGLAGGAANAAAMTSSTQILAAAQDEVPTRVPPLSVRRGRNIRRLAGALVELGLVLGVSLSCVFVIQMWRQRLWEVAGVTRLMLWRDNGLSGDTDSRRSGL